MISMATKGVVSLKSSGTLNDIATKVNIILKLTGHKVTRTGDIITIYESNGITIWRQYDLANGGRVQL